MTRGRPIEVERITTETTPATRHSHRVLVCEDDPQTLRALRVVLRGAGFGVDATGSVEEALNRAAHHPPAAAIIGLVLPDGDGVEVCRRLREWSAMPLILLSAGSEEEEKVRALEAGADDLVTKPFGRRELVARLHAKLRRADRGHEEPRVSVDGLEVDLAARTLWREGEEVRLTPIEFNLLRLLLRGRGRLLTHRALLQQVWGPAYTEDTQSLRTHIARLRRKIEPAEGLRHIRTDHGIGYRFVLDGGVGEMAHMADSSAHHIKGLRSPRSRESQ